MAFMIIGMILYLSRGEDKIGDFEIKKNEEPECRYNSSSSVIHHSFNSREHDFRYTFYDDGMIL